MSAARRAAPSLGFLQRSRTTWRRAVAVALGAARGVQPVAELIRACKAANAVRFPSDDAAHQAAAKGLITTADAWLRAPSAAARAGLTERLKGAASAVDAALDASTPARAWRADLDG